MRLAQAGLPVPATRYLAPAALAGCYDELAEELGLPFIVTGMTSVGGRDERLITNEREFNERVRDGGRAARFLAQEFIPNDVVHRLLVFGGDVPVVMCRPSTSAALLRGELEASYRLALVDRSEFDATAKRLAVQAAKVVGCDVASVELIRHRFTGEWYVVEANSSPAISTGAFAEDKVEAYSQYLRRKLAG